MRAYSWSKFGREAEFVTALYLNSEGWDVTLSKGSRGPADMIALRNNDVWFIQVKASMCMPRLKGYEVKHLIELACQCKGIPVVATLQPQSCEATAFTSGNFALSFYLLDGWTPLDPSRPVCSIPTASISQ